MGRLPKYFSSIEIQKAFNQVFAKKPGREPGFDQVLTWPESSSTCSIEQVETENLTLANTVLSHLIVTWELGE